MSYEKAQSLTPEEFEQWIKARDILSRVGRYLGAEYTAIGTLNRWVEARKLRVVAGSCFATQSGCDAGEWSLFEVSREWWAITKLSTNSDFWRSGELDLEISTGSYASPSKVFRLFDVRFEPKAIEQIAPAPRPKGLMGALVDGLSISATAAAPGAPEAEAPPHEAPKLSIPAIDREAGRPDTRKVLSDAEQERFSRMFVEYFKGLGTEALAHQSIMAMYPDRRVPRAHFLDIFRAIRGPKPRGKSKASGN